MRIDRKTLKKIISESARQMLNEIDAEKIDPRWADWKELTGWWEFPKINPEEPSFTWGVVDPNTLEELKNDFGKTKFVSEIDKDLFLKVLCHYQIEHPEEFKPKQGSNGKWAFDKSANFGKKNDMRWTYNNFDTCVRLANWLAKSSKVNKMEREEDQVEPIWDTSLRNNPSEIGDNEIINLGSSQDYVADFIAWVRENNYPYLRKNIIVINDLAKAVVESQVKGRVWWNRLLSNRNRDTFAPQDLKGDEEDIIGNTIPRKYKATTYDEGARSAKMGNNIFVQVDDAYYAITDLTMDMRAQEMYNKIVQDKLINESFNRFLGKKIL